MLTLKTRHKESCKRRNDGPRCFCGRCPIYADGTLHGVRIRKSLGVSSQRAAQHIVDGWELAGRVPKDKPGKPLSEVVRDFLADSAAEGLGEPTLRKYRRLLARFEAFARKDGRRLVSDFDIDAARQFQHTWTQGPKARCEQLRQMRKFGRFAQESGWADGNPFAALKPPKIPPPDGKPFTLDEMSAILRAAEGRPRERALIMLMRWSGLAIQDAVTLAKDRLRATMSEKQGVRGRILEVCRTKTSEPVMTLLPEFVCDVLESIPHASAKHYFWNGVQEPENAAKAAGMRLGKIFKRSGVPEAHSHRLRHTFAVELLQAGVLMESVSMLLGHRKIETTERYYARWTPGRQALAIDSVAQALTRDPLAVDAAFGSREAQDKACAPN